MHCSETISSTFKVAGVVPPTESHRPTSFQICIIFPNPPFPHTTTPSESLLSHLPLHSTPMPSPLPLTDKYEIAQYYQLGHDMFVATRTIDVGNSSFL